MTDRMIARRDGVIGWMIFNNPERHNAMSVDMWAAVSEIIAGFEADPAIRVIVLAGAGEKAFVSGADISQFDQLRSNAEQAAQYDEIASRANDALSAASKPTIAMIRGYCIGGGLGVALRCDLRIAAEGAQFAIPAAKLGLGYGYPGIALLTGIVGPSVAKDIFFTARRLGAEEALRVGLINHLVAPAELEQFTRRHAETIAANAPLTIRAAKMAIDLSAAGQPDARRLAAVDSAVSACFASEDYKEGRRAFAEKRPPAFKGR